jgi:UDP-N-acetylglucosamine/UDP-N-acetylgalactosamine 4-epimerase
VTTIKTKSKIEDVKKDLVANPKTWLVTGAAGFIGSHLVEQLAALNQSVKAVDNFITGRKENLEHLKKSLGKKWDDNVTFIEGDINDTEVIQIACKDVEIVLHQAALGSVPRSINDPLNSHHNNVNGFIKILTTAKDNGVKKFVYASSSSVYGDDKNEFKVESSTGTLLSPYAATKKIDEIYAAVFAKTYGIKTVGLRYFNVFGSRQDPNGAYAAVIPKWIGSLLKGQQCTINGNGTTSRDFCYIENVVSGNILAGITANLPESNSLVCNIACGDSTSLNELFSMIKNELNELNKDLGTLEAEYGPFRQGDIYCSKADISCASSNLGYEPLVRVAEGMKKTVEWYYYNQLNLY